MNSALGIHHITMITRKVQANVDFYAGFLGLKLVKRTAGFEDAMQLHLLYGDDIASPGSLLTFLVWEDGGQGRVGYGQTLEVSVAIDPAAIGFWLTRALKFGIRAEGPSDEFGEPVIRLKDPDGLIVKLVGTHAFADATPHVTDDISAQDAIRRIYGATMLSEVPEETVAFLEKHFGYRQESQTGAIRRLVSDSGDIIDVRDATGFWSSAPGTGTVDHIAFRAEDMDELNAVLTGLKSLNSSTTNAHDRKYFHSLYVREPGGVLIEMATDGPGMTIDEPLEALGEQLFIPPLFMKDEADVRVALPQFSMPGEERIIYRDLPFVHRFYTPEEPDGSTIILLHGSGGSETSLMPLAHRAARGAVLWACAAEARRKRSPAGSGVSPISASTRMTLRQKRRPLPPLSRVRSAPMVLIVRNCGLSAIRMARISMRPFPHFIPSLRETPCSTAPCRFSIHGRKQIFPAGISCSSPANATNIATEQPSCKAGLRRAAQRHGWKCWMTGMIWGLPI